MANATETAGQTALNDRQKDIARRLLLMRERSNQDDLAFHKNRQTNHPDEEQRRLGRIDQLERDQRDILAIWTHCKLGEK